MFFRSYRRKRLVAAANRRRDREDWLEAADLYRQALAIAPHSAALWIQFGHMLKEGGRIDEAEAAYLRATRLRPADADGWLQLGHARKRMGRRADAITAYATAASLDGALVAARHELLYLGGREALPENGPAGLERALALSGLASAATATERATEQWAMLAPRAPAEYDLFRARYPVPPPPGMAESAGLHVWVLADGAMPAAIRATLLSLIDQADPHWRATVLTDDMDDHPVASLARQEPRIAFTCAPAAGNDEAVLYLAAGTVADREAVGWLRYAFAETAADAIYADHDWRENDWANGATRYNPCFFPVYDPIFFAEAPEGPAAVCLRHGLDMVGIDLAVPPERALRNLLSTAGQRAPVAHLPRTLFSRCSVPRAITAAAPAAPRPTPSSMSQPPHRGEERIGIVIPTRDQPALLRACVTSLRDRSARPDLLDFVLLDNRSRAEDTGSTLRGLAVLPGLRVYPIDEPFNWSRFSNVGAQTLESGILCFANDDIECLTDAWDSQLIHSLDLPDVAVVGARLLYPDKTLQHGGVLFGFGRGSPIHEGIGMDENAGGPLRRWLTPRAVPAVTGAFLAIRREDFQAIGGFDELSLPVGFSDIDLCLRARKRGGLVLYEPRLTLIHHESKSRGTNDTLAKILWDHDELASFHARWGPAVLHDPGQNPAWSRQGRPFGGLIEPSERAVLDWLHKSARKHPWAP